MNKKILFGIVALSLLIMLVLSGCNKPITPQPPDTSKRCDEVYDLNCLSRLNKCEDKFTHYRGASTVCEGVGDVTAVEKCIVSERYDYGDYTAPDETRNVFFTDSELKGCKK